MKRLKRENKKLRDFLWEIRGELVLARTPAWDSIILKIEAKERKMQKREKKK